MKGVQGSLCTFVQVSRETELIKSVGSCSNMALKRLFIDDRVKPMHIHSGFTAVRLTLKIVLLRVYRETSIHLFRIPGRQSLLSQ